MQIELPVEKLPIINWNAKSFSPPETKTISDNQTNPLNPIQRVFFPLSFLTEIPFLLLFYLSCSLQRI